MLRPARRTPLQPASLTDEKKAPPPSDAPEGAAGALACLAPLKSPKESSKACLKFPGGVTASELACDVAIIEETNRHADRVPGSIASGAGAGPSGELGLTGAKRPAQGSALGGSLRSATRRRPAADSSSVATPTRIASGSASVTNDATEKKGKVVQERATTKRGGAAGRGQKGKATERVTASEYAKRKNAEFEARRLSGKKTKFKQFLEGKRIFYYGNDMGFPSEDTRRKMDIVSG